MARVTRVKPNYKKFPKNDGKYLEMPKNRNEGKELSAYVHSLIEAKIIK